MYPLACHVKGSLSFQHYKSCRSLQKGINLSYLHLIKYWVLFYLYIRIYENSENWSQMITLFKQYDSCELCEIDNDKFLTFRKSVFFSHITSLVNALFSFFCQISLRFRLKHSTGTHHAIFVCPPSLPVWLRSGIFWDSYVLLLRLD